MKKEERLSRIMARGEVSGHAHIVTGSCVIQEENGVTKITAGKDCAIKHLLEQPFVEEGREVWTEEHADIALKEGSSYEVVRQIEYNPYEKATRKVQD